MSREKTSNILLKQLIMQDDPCLQHVRGMIPSSLLRGIEKSPRIVFDFSPAGILTISTPDYKMIAFDTTVLKPAVAEILIVACLNDKIVMGRDLYTSFALCTAITEDWRPSCSLNIESLGKELFPKMPSDPALGAYEQILAWTGKKTFGTAFDMLMELDERKGGTFFRVIELMPQTMGHVCAEAINMHLFDRTDTITFEAYVNSDFVKRKACLMSSSKVRLLEFDIKDLPAVHIEFEMAMNCVTKSLTVARNASLL